MKTVDGPDNPLAKVVKASYQDKEENNSQGTENFPEEHFPADLSPGLGTLVISNSSLW